MLKLLAALHRFQVTHLFAPVWFNWNRVQFLIVEDHRQPHNGKVATPQQYCYKITVRRVYSLALGAGTKLHSLLYTPFLYYIHL